MCELTIDFEHWPVRTCDAKHALQMQMRHLKNCFGTQLRFQDQICIEIRIFDRKIFSFPIIKKNIQKTSAIILLLLKVNK